MARKTVALKLTLDELEVIGKALSIWEATPPGGDVGEDEKDSLASACGTAQRKITEAEVAFRSSTANALVEV